MSNFIEAEELAWKLAALLPEFSAAELVGSACAFLALTPDDPSTQTHLRALRRQ